MSAQWHPLLQRQLARAGVGPGGDGSGASQGHELSELLDRVSRTYEQADSLRYQLERSLEVSAREMSELHRDLQASEARLASLVSLSSDWIWEQDSQRRFRYVSSADSSGSDIASQLLNRCADELLRPVSEDDASEYLRCLAAREPFRNVICALQGGVDGQPFFLRISGEPVFRDGSFVGYRGVGSDVTRATVSERRAAELAQSDVLTGIANRAIFVERLDRALLESGDRPPPAVFFIDIDRFKTINDSLGHTCGDELLKILATRLTGLLRGSDMVARWGGDEFVAMIGGCRDPHALAGVARRALTTLAEPMTIQDRTLHVTASIGISVFPSDGQDAATLLKSADSAMYLAKSRGRNTFEFFTARLAQRADERFALEVALRQALERGELRLHYQPRFSAPDLRICGMEALVRWQHPTRGLVSAGEFIPIAEESGLINEIGQWVMHEACRQIRQWREAGLEPPRCSVNLSAKQIVGDALVDDVRAALSAGGIEPAALELEVTESALMIDPEHARAEVQKLHELGVRVAIDDFGTGYSSLAYLKRFRAETLKLDRSFVSGLPDERDDVAITQAIIAMAHSMHMRVVAEGVQTPEQLHFLQQLDCDEVQGFLLGRPLPPAALASLLASSAHSDVRTPAAAPTTTATSPH